jgi:LacI family xylobiose transport system transcriptional regulator
VIAQLAGVSKPTVSKVLNGRAGVASETRQRVEALLREHGYRRPDAIAPAAVLEVVFYGLGRHMAIEIMRGVEPVAREHELAVAFTDVGSSTASGRSWAEQLLTRHPVGATNWSGGIAAARHPLDLGHRRIAVVGGPLHSLGARARLEGCRAAMDAAGVRLDDRLVRASEFTFEDGSDLGRELLTRPDPPTAVLCGNDLQALGVCTAAWRLGLRIPQDLSVVGFDDIDNTRWCCPPMTTVRQPLVEMGATAARMLMTLTAGDTPVQSRVELATTLVVRDSTAPPRA